MAGWEDVDRLAMAMPDAERYETRGGRAWRVNKKLFVWERPLRKSDLEALGASAPDGPILGARVEHEVAKHALVQSEPDVFFTTPHFDGYPAVLIRLDRISLEILEEVVVEAWLARAPGRSRSVITDKLEKTHSPRDLFLGDLSAMLEVEKQIAKALPGMQKAANDHRLSQRLGRHEKETREHVKRLERAFKTLGVRPHRRKAAGIEGLATEFKESARSTGPELVDIITLGVANRVEHYEIAAYESLIEMARALGEKDVQQLLERNLKEEKGMLADAAKHTRRLHEAAAKLEA